MEKSRLLDYVIPITQAIFEDFPTMVYSFPIPSHYPFLFWSSLSENRFDLLDLWECLPILLLFIKAHPNLRRDYCLSPVLTSVSWGSSFIDGFFWIWTKKMEMTVPIFLFLWNALLILLLLALIALFFNAYAVEADIRLLAFYLHLPDRKGFALFGMNSQRLDPGSLVEWLYKTPLSQWN